MDIIIDKVQLVMNFYTNEENLCSTWIILAIFMLVAVFSPS